MTQWRDRRRLLPTGVLCAAIAVVGILWGTALHADVPVTITYTADNIVGAWWQNGGNPVSQDLGDNRGQWQQADSRTINLAPGHAYQFIWHVENEGTLSSGNPAGFLAQIACDADPNYDVLSNSSTGNWEWVSAVDVNTTVTDFSFDDLDWAPVTAHDTGGTEAWNGGDNIWSDVNGGPIAGIASGADGAYWIWAQLNTSTYADIYIRYNSSGIELVPEPFGAPLLALSSVFLLVRRRRRK